MTNSRRTIVLCLVATLAINVVKHLKNKEIPTADIGIGAALTGIFLLGMAEFAPKVASGFALIMFVVALGGGPNSTGGQLETVKAISGLVEKRAD